VKLEIGKEIWRTKGAAVEGGGKEKKESLFCRPNLRAHSGGAAPAQRWIINDGFFLPCCD